MSGQVQPQIKDVRDGEAHGAGISPELTIRVSSIAKVYVAIDEVYEFRNKNDMTDHLYMSQRLANAPSCNRVLVLETSDGDKIVGHVHEYLDGTVRVTIYSDHNHPLVKKFIELLLR